MFDINYNNHNLFLFWCVHAKWLLNPASHRPAKSQMDNGNQWAPRIFAPLSHTPTFLYKHLVRVGAETKRDCETQTFSQIGE